MSILTIGLLLARMKADQWKSREELEQMQLSRLNELIGFARSNVPHYRTLPREPLKELDSLAGLPILEKNEIRADAGSFLAGNLRKEQLVRHITSGSTGMPLEVFHRHSESAYGKAFQMHQMLEAGVKPLDRQVWITADRYEPNMLNRLGLFARQHILFRNAGQLLDEVRRASPSVLRGTPSFIIPLAQENIRAGSGLRLSKAFCFSETLSKNARALISSSFGCRVFDSYGSVETSWAAWECEKGSMHVHSDNIIAEIVDKGGRPVPGGQSGDLLLTPLWQRAMPFIRYRIGDRAAFGPECGCGRGLRTIKSLEGRSNDLIVLPSGKRCSAHLIGFNLRAIEGIMQFRSVQEKDGSICISIMAGNGPNAALAKLAKERIAAALPEPLEIDVSFVDVLSPDRRGKLRDFQSKIAP